MSRNKHRGTAKDKANQQDFTAFLKKLFWVGCIDLNNQIRGHKKCSNEDKHEDLSHLGDQEGPRHLTLGSEDRKFHKKVFFTIVSKYMYNIHTNYVYIHIVYIKTNDF